MPSAAVRAVLEERRDAVAARLAGCALPALEGDSRAMGFRDDGDVDAAGLLARDLAAGERERLLAEHRQVLEALARLAAGEYGICMDCDHTIAPKRLAAVPWVERCLGCQERHERDTRVVRVRIADEEDEAEAPEP